MPLLWVAKNCNESWMSLRQGKNRKNLQQNAKNKIWTVNKAEAPVHWSKYTTTKISKGFIKYLWSFILTFLRANTFKVSTKGRRDYRSRPFVIMALFQMYLTVIVVYFDQRLGTAHAKRWLKLDSRRNLQTKILS